MLSHATRPSVPRCTVGCQGLQPGPHRLAGRADDQEVPVQKFLQEIRAGQNQCAGSTQDMPQGLHVTPSSACKYVQSRCPVMTERAATHCGDAIRFHWFYSILLNGINIYKDLLEANRAHRCPAIHRGDAFRFHSFDSVNPRESKTWPPFSKPTTFQ